MDANKSTDRVRKTLEKMIVQGDFQDGARLDETSLAERLGVSRTPLREAFQSLAASGLLEIRPRRGAFVKFPTLEDMIEMFDVMAEIEALCGRYAARRMSAIQQAEIEAALNACERAFEMNDPEEYYRANHAFHNGIYEASGNRFLAGEADRLHMRLAPFRRLQLLVRGRMRESLREHQEIFAALVNGDESAISQLMKNHISVQGERFNDLAASYRTTVQARRSARPSDA